jgi:NAD(P)-dependent dehydrogenase (short-subunit alcohol dehydrogenase family)
MCTLDGKVVLVSGTARGIGRAVALELAARGARVFGCDLDVEGSDETVRLVREAGGVMQALAPVDLSTQEGADAWISSGLDAFGDIVVLFNNASALRHGPIDTMPIEDWYFTIQNELHIVFHCTRAAWPHLVKRGGGSIINVGSIAGMRGVEFVPMAPHGAAKGGVLAFTMHTCAAGAGLNIRANAISPGMIGTPETAQFTEDPNGPVPGLIARTPSRRIGQPEDIANLVAFLASDDSSYINGANIVIDGGVSAMGG